MQLCWWLTRGSKRAIQSNGNTDTRVLYTIHSDLCLYVTECICSNLIIQVMDKRRDTHLFHRNYQSKICMQRAERESNCDISYEEIECISDRDRLLVVLLRATKEASKRSMQLPWSILSWPESGSNPLKCSALPSSRWKFSIFATFKILSKKHSSALSWLVHQCSFCGRY